MSFFFTLKLWLRNTEVSLSLSSRLLCSQNPCYVHSKKKESIYGSTGVSSLILHGLEGEDVLLTESTEQDETISQHQAVTSFWNSSRAEPQCCGVIWGKWKQSSSIQSRSDHADNNFPEEACRCIRLCVCVSSNLNAKTQHSRRTATQKRWWYGLTEL